MRRDWSCPEQWEGSEGIGGGVLSREGGRVGWLMACPEDAVVGVLYVGLRGS